MSARRLRRTVLAGAALAMFAGPPLAAGCAASYPPISEIDGLRVLAVVADKPYAQPGDEVTFTLTYEDSEATGAAPDVGGGGAASTSDAGVTTRARAIQVAWIGGCYDPAGDEYYECYSQLGAALGALESGEIPSGVAFALGDSTAPRTSAAFAATRTFTLTLPEDLISKRPAPAAGDPYYGLAYVFFAVCAGQFKAAAPVTGAGLAGSFPIACVDEAGNQLGADSFVPGYTSVYAFEDKRTNQNPVVTGLSIVNGDTGLGVEDVGPVAPCSIAESTRNAAGCGATNPFTACTAYGVQVDVPSDVAEVDPSTRGPDGTPLHEEVWVDYYADSGDVQDPILLVSDPTLGIRSGFNTLWIPPPFSGTANIWAVVHDSRGGETIIQRQIVVD